MTTEPSLQCHVCGDTAEDEKLISECFSCGRPFHLNPYSSGDHRDCGDAMIGPNTGVEFWCNPCLSALEEAERDAGMHDPRAIFERLTSGDQLMSPPRTAPPESQPRPAIPDAPPARRGRTTPPRRYRRIDGA